MDKFVVVDGNQRVYRKDNDGHGYGVPTELLEEFDDLFGRYSRAKRFSDEMYDLEAEFCNKFDQFMVD